MPRHSRARPCSPSSGGGLRGWARLRPAAQQPVHRGRTVTLASGDGASTRSWSCDTCVTQVAARLRGEQGHRQAGPPLQTLGVRPARGLSSGLRQQRSTLTVKGLRWGQKAAPGQGCVDTQGCWEPPRRPGEGGHPPAGRLANWTRSSLRARRPQQQGHEPAPLSGDTRSHWAAPGALPTALLGEGPGQAVSALRPTGRHPYLRRLGEASLLRFAQILTTVKRI